MASQICLYACFDWLFVFLHAFSRFCMFWALLGHSGALLGTLGTLLGVSWSSFGRSWGTLGALLDALGALLGHSWALLGAFWRRLVKKGRCAQLFEAQLGAQMEPSWSQNPLKIGFKKRCKFTDGFLLCFNKFAIVLGAPNRSFLAILFKRSFGTAIW